MLLYFLKLADLKFYQNTSYWATKSCPKFAYVRKFTYLSAAKQNKENSNTWQR